MTVLYGLSVGVAYSLARTGLRSVCESIMKVSSMASWSTAGSSGSADVGEGTGGLVDVNVLIVDLHLGEIAVQTFGHQHLRPPRLGTVCRHWAQPWGDRTRRGLLDLLVLNNMNDMHAIANLPPISSFSRKRFSTSLKS